MYKYITVPEIVTTVHIIFRSFFLSTKCLLRCPPERQGKKFLRWESSVHPEETVR
jgi:hypothetical protein